VSWLEELRTELASVPMPARRRARIQAELEDHLRCDPTAVERLGDPREVARGFADEVGTALSRRAAVGVFVALAPLGLLFGALFALVGALNVVVAHRMAVDLGLILGTQVAFVGGTLALLRAWRLRRARVVPAGQAAVLLRRGALGLGGGIVTVAAVAAGASQAPADVAAWFAPLAYATAGVGAITLTGAGVALAQAARLRPATTGAAGGDLASDLGPLVPRALRDDPWRLALAIATGAAVCIAAAGIVQGDPLDGVVRAVADGALCLAGFALLGRWLGLRR
jgi:hypothetical protein